MLADDRVLGGMGLPLRPVENLLLLVPGESEALVLLLGPKSVDTPSLFFELGAALALRKRIIPVVSKAVDRSRIPLPLLRRRYVVQGNPQETAEEVARAVA